MLYDDKLTTFRTVAEEGSFSQAAELLYTSHTSVIKRINALEAQVGVKLINRNNRGVELTAAGKSFYNDTLQIIDSIDSAVSRAQQLANLPRQFTVRVGCSMFYPGGKYISLWDRVSDLHPNINIELVMFNDSDRSLIDIGNEYDCLIGPFESEFFSDKYSLLPIDVCHICIGVSRKSPLSKKEQLTFRDLQRKKLCILPEKVSCGFDRVRKEMASSCEEMLIEEISPYINVKLLNECAEGKFMLLFLDCWSDLHPSIKCVPLECASDYQFGIIYAKKPSQEMKEFIDAIKNTSWER